MLVTATKRRFLYDRVTFVLSVRFHETRHRTVVLAHDLNNKTKYLVSQLEAFIGRTGETLPTFGRLSGTGLATRRQRHKKMSSFRGGFLCPREICLSLLAAASALN
jgi:hypothetical protein